MAKLSLHQDIDCNAETFWKQFFDPVLITRLFLEGLGFREYAVVRQVETAVTIVRAISAVPTLNVPGPVAKALGSSFGYAEEGTFDKATSIWRWKMIPSTLSGKLRCTGAMSLSPLGEDRVRRALEIEIEANVFMIGGMIEEAFRKQLSDGWEKGAVVQNEWLRDPK